jgi:hypothetical protein
MEGIYRCEAWPLFVGQEYKLKVFEDRMLRGTVGLIRWKDTTKIMQLGISE